MYFMLILYEMLTQVYNSQCIACNVITNKNNQLMHVFLIIF